MSGDFNPGLIEVLNSAPSAEAGRMERAVPVRRHLPTPRWLSGGSVVRGIGLALLAVVLGGWVLTLLNAR